MPFVPAGERWPEFSFRSILRALWKRKLLIVLIWAAVTGIAMLSVHRIGSSLQCDGHRSGRSVVGAIDVAAGTGVQSRVDSYPGGTTFQLGPGIFRLQEIAPKNSDVFIGTLGPNGERLTILSGARLLTSFQRQGSYWVVRGQTQEGQQNGSCLDGYPRCDRPEDFFIDDVPLWHVDSLVAVGPGKYFFDYPADKIYFWDNPTGHKVETSVSYAAFYGPATGVVIQNVIVEKYAIPVQFGAIGGEVSGASWTVDNCEIRWNHGAGIHISADGWSVRNSYIHDQGQIGMTAGIDSAHPINRAVIENNELADNKDYAGVSMGFEAGGSKFSDTADLTVRNNFVHGNVMAGLWTDGYNIRAEYANNTIVDNPGTGIFHEVSCQVNIHDNVIRRNGSPRTLGIIRPFQESFAILISSSREANIYNNVIQIDTATDTNAIGLMQQSDRHVTDPQTGLEVSECNPLCTCFVIRNSVHNNAITMTGTTGYGGSGAFQDVAGSPPVPDLFTRGNSFDYNTYHVTRLSDLHWIWGAVGTWGDFLKWSEFRAFGQEPHGTVDTNISVPNPPAITSPRTAAAIVGQVFSYQATASSTPLAVEAAPLPAGLTLNRRTGRIYGTPTAPGQTNVTLRVMNADGIGTANLRLRVSTSAP